MKTLAAMTPGQDEELRAIRSLIDLNYTPKFALEMVEGMLAIM